MDNRKHSKAAPVKQSERVLGFVRAHRLLFVVFAAVLVAGFVAWLTWAIVDQSTRNRAALALSELQDRGEQWKAERAKLLKAKEESEAEALLPPEESTGLTVAGGANAEEATGGGAIGKGKQATEAAKPTEGEQTTEAVKTAEKEKPSSATDEIAALDKGFAVYVQQLIDGQRDDVVQVEALWWQVQLREETKDFPGAQESLAKIYQDYPRQPSARVALMRSANLYYQQEQDEQAIEQWDLLRAGDDGLALTAALHLGMVRTKRGEYQQARKLLERFLNESADVPQSEGWQNLADSYLIALDVLEQGASSGGDAQVQLSDSEVKTKPEQVESAGTETKPAPTEPPGNEAKPAQ